jgi:Family of unknown function (DUF5681)
MRKPRGRPFQPGNPGRPRGSKNRVTQTLEQIAEEQAEQLFQKILKQALAGDVPCQKMLLDRIWPPRKAQPINVTMPRITNSQDALAAIAEIRLTPDEITALCSVVGRSSFFCRKIVLAYYVGGLRRDDGDPGEAEARALNYESRNDYLEALFKGEKSEINRRFKDAARHLFAQVGLDFDRSPPSALCESFVRLVKQLPEPWLRWLQSNLQEGCHGAPIGTSRLIQSDCRV